MDPHIAFGVEVTAMVSTSAVMSIREPPVSVDAPDPVAVVVDPSTSLSSIGPMAVGQVRTAVGTRQSCGASPTAVMVADAASFPPRVAKLTLKLGFCPLTLGSRVVRSTMAVPALADPGIETLVHPAIGAPASVVTVSFAPV
jgi:hypothetical protein